MKLFNSALCGLVLLSIASFAQADIAVIVAKDSGLTASGDQIPRIFLGKLKNFDSGEVATPIYAQDENPSHKEFNSKVLKKSAGQLKAYWSKLLFSGKGAPPKEFASDADIINAVVANKGTIGYISAASVTDGVTVIGTY
ncbi:phosphate ABC transporter substrate-binding protein [Alteromonas sp. 5E99-2]|uniref:phosphate ABC transporter substrate-binding protein n=1 Tax=Alteromonas sp. 5E99-2 TaxID=2817683 RepID=UPI001A99D882|nr:phosphate ABC transporter substrate-binding protein [Alteromonas sp. 5E99-2]MBO1256115.1 phosphate ABC transporter substrate-binding protein [Alteromonas sp. 5E99-2]